MERLVTLIEVLLTMNCPSPPNTYVEHSKEMQEQEDDQPHNGLPLSNAWPRAERARAAAQWRPRAAGHSALTDPQCAPCAQEMTPLLRPVGAPHRALLLITALRLAKVPLLPHTEYAYFALHGAHASPTRLADTDAVALLPLLDADARVHPSTAAVCLRWCTPPHYLSDEHGYLSWVEWLWDCACEWSCGTERQALLCWRIRWHGALLRLAGEGGAGERRRLRQRMKGALRKWGTAVSFAELSRMESCDERAARMCIAAAFGGEHGCSSEVRLYAGRLLLQREYPWASCVLACAALGRRVPCEWPTQGEREELLAEACRECERRCLEIEGRLEAETAPEDDGAVDVGVLLLPGEGEWARARASLCTEGRLRTLCESDAGAPAGASMASRRWREENTEGLVVAARVRLRGSLATAHAWKMRATYPHNAVLAREAGRVPLWRALKHTSASGSRTTSPQGATLPALGELLPCLLRAESEGWSAPSARSVLRKARQWSCGGEGSPLLWSMLAAAEARAGAPRGAVLRGLQCVPHHKWLYVSAVECGAVPTLEAIDLLMERELRLHSMPEELVQDITCNKTC